MRKKKIVILGAGLAGLATAYFLKKKKIDAYIFEKEERPGGLCRSQRKDGFTFDFSGHLLHFRNPQILSLVKGLLGKNLIKHKRKAFIYDFDRFIPYPFQTNLNSLPEKVSLECLLGFIEAHNNSRLSLKNNNFSDWINNKFGEGIAKYFMIPYNLKFWKTPMEKLSYEWADRFIVTPSVEDIIDSFLGRDSENLGYHAFFWSPRKGGIEELIKAFAFNLKNIHLNCEATSINLNEKEVKFKNGSKERFDILISTLPLPELPRIIKGLSQDILSWFEKLRWLSIYNINLGVAGKIQPKRHWIYFPQKQFKFFRVGFYHNFSSLTAPSGKSSLYIEVSYSKNKPLDRKRIETGVIKNLIKPEIVDKDNGIETKLINDIKYAYPIYDRNWEKARGKILDYLSSYNIYSVGRFGSWRYLSMEDVILEGENIANTLTNSTAGVDRI